MGEALAVLISMFGVKLFYPIGLWIIKVLSLGKFGVQDLPKVAKAHFVEAWDETNKDGSVDWKEPDMKPHKWLEKNTFHYGVAIGVGAIVVIGLFCVLLLMNRDYFLSTHLNA